MSSEWPHGTIGFVGTGSMTQALASQFATSGVPVLIGSRTPEKAKALAAEIGSGARACESIKNVIRECGTIWVCLANAKAADGKYGVVEFLETYKGDLVGSGKILIETSNPYLAGFAPPAPHESAMTYHAEYLKSLGDESTAWATAYNSIYFKSITGVKKQPTEMCGDYRARVVLKALIEQHGWEAADYGGLDSAPLLEPRGPKRVKHPRIVEYDGCDGLPGK
ncbi:unnamed protein product [Polarella glacialis]|uniref:6-phosphogluconate dehydrogenase NADP-binding domain-containing protein n=1 Tax=Polarella glacialis TaxID=89957 RepID=A0A813GWF1_POLGL|nr:unnamed protein product [Polarella glacialis]